MGRDEDRQIERGSQSGRREYCWETGVRKYEEEANTERKVRGERQMFSSRYDDLFNFGTHSSFQKVYVQPRCMYVGCCSSCVSTGSERICWHLQPPIRL